MTPFAATAATMERRLVTLELDAFLGHRHVVCVRLGEADRQRLGHRSEVDIGERDLEVAGWQTGVRVPISVMSTLLLFRGKHTGAVSLPRSEHRLVRKLWANDGCALSYSTTRYAVALRYLKQ